eukprot:TRINITY_DN4206_c0_g1_i1.p1 TRINITY_DN4206_c0_g1~~TRINITY_DN4206_c0_g1_i1.p1  ORF type:complete len:460 (-),score=88.73 TRINITY_DN4206_c0_g1_i1:99-1478(-)
MKIGKTKTPKTLVHKASNHKEAPPKEKHVKAILMRASSKTETESIIRHLESRLNKSNWVVVLKCLMVYHRCLSDSNLPFFDMFKPVASDTFALQNFLKVAPPTHIYTIFSQKYAKYLEEKVSVVGIYGLPFESISSEIFQNTKSPKYFDAVQKLQSELNALLNCKMKSQHVLENTLIKSTFVLLIKDALTLYPVLEDVIEKLTHSYKKADKKELSLIINIYKLYIAETDSLIGMYDLGRKFVQELPDIKRADREVLETMEATLRGMEDPSGEDERVHSPRKRVAHYELDVDIKEYDEECVNSSQQTRDDDDSESSGEESSDVEPEVLLKQMLNSSDFISKRREPLPQPFGDPTTIPITPNPYMTGHSPYASPPKISQSPTKLSGIFPVPTSSPRHSVGDRSPVPSKTPRSDGLSSSRRASEYSTPTKTRTPKSNDEVHRKTSRLKDNAIGGISAEELGS